MKKELLTLLTQRNEILKYNKVKTLFPADGKYARKEYPKHLAFMAAGATFKQRAIIAANRTGKTLMGAFEMALHLTGLYPDWWVGRKFYGGISAWAVGLTEQQMKEVIQFELLGPPEDLGSGMIPKDCIIGKPAGKSGGTSGLVESVVVKHVSGEKSKLTFKCCSQGWENFQGTKKDVIWIDEEPPDYKIYTECLTRTIDDTEYGGMIYCTFTPLKGFSEVVLSYMPGGKLPDQKNLLDSSRYVTTVTWDDVPHLTDKQKVELKASFLPHEIEARTKGEPSLGAGAIYPFARSDIEVEPFKIPESWPKGYGMDVGWNCTACVFAAKDPNSGRIYIYDEYYAGEEQPIIHASAIKSITGGSWMVGAVDPKARDRAQTDGAKLFDLYKKEGLRQVAADNSVEMGIQNIRQMFLTGQLKIFSTVRHFWDEFRLYRRDENGKIVKKNDHVMDATRYFFNTGIDYMLAEPQYMEAWQDDDFDDTRDDLTGY